MNERRIYQLTKTADKKFQAIELLGTTDEVKTYYTTSRVSRSYYQEHTVTRQNQIHHITAEEMAKLMDKYEAMGVMDRRDAVPTDGESTKNGWVITLNWSKLNQK